MTQSHDQTLTPALRSPPRARGESVAALSVSRPVLHGVRIQTSRFAEEESTPRPKRQHRRHRCSRHPHRRSSARRSRCAHAVCATMSRSVWMMALSISRFLSFSPLSVCSSTAFVFSTFWGPTNDSPHSPSPLRFARAPARRRCRHAPVTLVACTQLLFGGLLRNRAGWEQPEGTAAAGVLCRSFATTGCASDADVRSSVERRRVRSVARAGSRSAGTQRSELSAKAKLAACFARQAVNNNLSLLSRKGLAL